jgi:hypothetical protein
MGDEFVLIVAVVNMMMILYDDYDVVYCVALLYRLDGSIRLAVAVEIYLRPPWRNLTDHREHVLSIW